MKFNDLDGDGEKDTVELGLAGWTIKLCADSACNTVLQTATTDANGVYSFSVTPDADKSDADNDPYYVLEVQQTGWTQTAPTTVFYGPITVTSANYQIINQDFGNEQFIAAPSLSLLKQISTSASGPWSSSITVPVVAVSTTCSPSTILATCR